MTFEERARGLMTEDGEWPSAAYETGPQARRAAAMQEAITLLCDAITKLRLDVDALQETVDRLEGK